MARVQEVKEYSRDISRYRLIVMNHGTLHCALDPVRGYVLLRNLLETL
jgi:hypothetical protein